MDHNQNHAPGSEDTGFRYTYSAKEQAELKKIRDKYTTDKGPVSTNKMEQIRRLDAAVTKKATTVALVVGIIGTLIMGMGMSLIMTDLRDAFGLDSTTALLGGIIVGFVGMIGVIVAYPLYQHILAKERQKIAPQILRLTDEWMEEN